MLLPATGNLQPADLVLQKGNIYTVNDRQPRAEAVAVKGDRIVFVGSNREAQKYIGKKTRVIDLKGETVVPGMTDAHHHLEGVGFREMTLNLEGVNSLEEFRDRLIETYPAMTTSQLADAIADGLTAASLAGRDDILRGL